MFFSLIIVLYAGSLAFFTSVWRRKIKQNPSEQQKTVSIVVPFRDEEEDLPSLLQSLKKIKYPNDLLDIVFVDDHSEDASLLILKNSLEFFPYSYKIISLSDEHMGKKEALIEGISHSGADIILTTDADCIVPENWVEHMQNPFSDSAIHLVSGNVVFSTNNFLSKVFQMEFATLIGVGAVSIKLGKNTMANGANLAFRRSTFLSLKPFDDNLHIPTGDDVFLLQKISSRYPGAVFFQKCAVVTSQAPRHLKEFINQRIRWASKWKASAERKNKLPALAVWAFHLIYLIAIGTLINQPIGQTTTILLLVAVLVKAVMEYIFICSVLKEQQQKCNLLAFCFLQFFYSIYVVLFGLLANFASYHWKGRNYGKYDR